MASKSPDPFGFFFWLKWILLFGISLVSVSVFWTFTIQTIFGGIRGNELTLTWVLAVFGTWFLIVTPFMRKKEQIWKRLNVDQEKAVDAWLFGIGCFIGILILSSLGWSFYFREALKSKAHDWVLDPDWAKNVFGTWLIATLPFLIYFYRIADRIFRDAEKRQTATGTRFRRQFIEKSQRTLPQHLIKDLENQPETLTQGHVVNLILKDGSRIPNVFVLNAKEILGIYDRVEPGFKIEDITQIEALTAHELPAYEEEKWLRLDGRG